MNKRLLALAKQMVPESGIRQINRLLKRGHAADLAVAQEFKREFFWNAFRALDFNGITGDYVEFGSATGVTFRLAFDQMQKRKIERHMWAFDSFEGLPASASPQDDHPKWQQGILKTPVDDFHAICRAHGIREHAYSVVQGFYEDTLPQRSLDTPPTDIALAYIDCDMYSSTKTVLEYLKPRLKHGMILAFDDYFCWSAGTLSGERQALLEVLASDTRWHLMRYRDYGWAGASFVVERADLVSP